jgi:hypothetical protein
MLVWCLPRCLPRKSPGQATAAGAGRRPRPFPRPRHARALHAHATPRDRRRIVAFSAMARSGLGRFFVARAGQGIRLAADVVKRQEPRSCLAKPRSPEDNRSIGGNPSEGRLL